MIVHMFILDLHAFVACLAKCRCIFELGLLDLSLFAGVDINHVIDRGVFLGKSALCWVSNFLPALNC